VPRHGAVDLQVVPARGEDRRPDARPRHAGPALRLPPAAAAREGADGRARLEQAEAEVKSARPVGIAGYGADVPRLRVRTADISKAWRPRGAIAPAVTEKSVPGPDEDVVTMAIEAARTSLDRAGIDLDRIGAVWVGTESKPYAVKPSATIVAEALGITPHVVAADMEFACKAGSEAMQAAVAFVGAGMVDAALAIGMDTAQSKPGDALEYTAGCGGAAYLFADAEDALAVVEASVSHVTDTPDFFRREGAAYPEHGGRLPRAPPHFTHTPGPPPPPVPPSRAA